MARPSFQPTEDQRRQVKKMAAVGMPHDLVAEIIGITSKTLRKYFRRDLTRGDAEGKLRIASKLMQSVDAGNVTARIYMAKMRLGWREDRQVPPPLSPPSFVVTVEPQPEEAKPGDGSKSEKGE